MNSCPDSLFPRACYIVYQPYKIKTVQRSRPSPNLPGVRDHQQQQLADLVGITTSFLPPLVFHLHGFLYAHPESCLSVVMGERGTRDLAMDGPISPK